MLHLVKKDFTDKHTGEDYKAGDVIDISEERADEILQTCEVILPLDKIIAAYVPATEPAEEPANEEKEQTKPTRRRTKKEGEAK